MPNLFVKLLELLCYCEAQTVSSQTEEQTENDMTVYPTTKMVLNLILAFHCSSTYNTEMRTSEN
jgi:hypothetical protein